MKTGGKRGLIVFSCYFLFSCLVGIGWLSGGGGLGQPALPMGKRKPISNVECGMANGEVVGAPGGGAEEADFDRKWTRMDANAGPGGEFQPRSRQEICLFSCWIAEGPGARCAAAWRGS